MSESGWAWTRDLEGQERALIRAHGPDVVRFLQGLLSQDVEAIAEGTALPACLLTLKGKISFDMAVLRRGEQEFWLVLPAARRAECLEKLDRHLIMDEVELEAVERKVGVAWGPSAPEGVGVEAVKTTYPVRGWLLLGGDEASLDGASDKSAFDAHRVAHAVPASGQEVVEGRFPPEVGFVDSVSYTKGCFMGQEPLSRLHSRGQSNWVMARLRQIEGEAPTELPTTLRHPDREKAAELTTLADGGGLAIVHRKLASPGTVLNAEGARFELESGPLGQDEGVQKTSTVVKLGG